MGRKKIKFVLRFLVLRKINKLIRVTVLYRNVELTPGHTGECVNIFFGIL
jgi:hypothetical protein